MIQGICSVIHDIFTGLGTRGSDGANPSMGAREDEMLPASKKRKKKGVNSFFFVFILLSTDCSIYTTQMNKCLFFLVHQFKCLSIPIRPSQRNPVFIQWLKESHKIDQYNGYLESLAFSLHVVLARTNLLFEGPKVPRASPWRAPMLWMVCEWVPASQGKHETSGEPASAPSPDSEVQFYVQMTT